ncbi:MAG: methyltransferase domain-containing protein [Proteobacteria bacterium]|nr:methyltransferase domain-containing protein [Pseudomonadota bacterium]
MITISPDNKTDREIGASWASGGTLLGKVFIPLTRYLRARQGLSVIKGTESHLDMGCGDCYFLLNSPCKKRIGLDMRFGDDLNKGGLDFPDDSFDNVSMIAVIEHLEEPKRIVKEIARILKPGGHFIVTTPLEKGEWIMKLLKKDISEIHEEYYGPSEMRSLVEGSLELKVFRKFLFGFNQLFVMEKPAK